MSLGLSTTGEQKLGRVQTKKARTRARLMEAAYTLISTKGIDDTTIQEMTGLADVGFGTFYNYFGSKDEIAVRVLDCVINALGRCNDEANRSLQISCPIVVVANSVRLVAREMKTDPIWRWWLKRQDIVVERMRAGFKPFGIRDMNAAIESRRYHIADGDLETAWSFLIWILFGHIKDVIGGHRPPESERVMAEAVLRIMGVERNLAHAASIKPLPDLPRLKIDFTFELCRAPLTAS